MKQEVLCTFSIFLVVLFAIPMVFAVSVPSGQRDLVLVAEIGRGNSFYLVLQDVSSDTNITASGDRSGWVSFGSDGSSQFTAHPSLTGIVPLRLSVPSDAQLGTYEISILAEGSEIAHISVITTLQQDAIRALQDRVNVLQNLADVNGNIDMVNMRLDSINQKINSTEANIKTIADSQSELKGIRNETSALSAKVDDLMSSSQPNGITGMFLLEAPVDIVVGFTIGAMLVFILSNRKKFSQLRIHHPNR